MTTKNESNTVPWFWLIVIGGVLAVIVEGCNGVSRTTTTSSNYTPDRGTVEHRYATERFRQEGLSTKDAQTAADAVMKFHNAQKNR